MSDDDRHIVIISKHFQSNHFSFAFIILDNCEKKEKLFNTA